MKSKLQKIILITLCLFMLSSASLEAQTPTPPTPPPTQNKDYTLLVPLPGVTSEANCVGIKCETTLATYLPNIFKLAIGIAAVMAFVMITFGGITYAVADSITGKESGKTYIENALWGLLLVIGAYTILYTINPQLVQLQLEIKRPEIKSAEPTVTAIPGTCQPPSCRSLNSIGLGGIASGSAVGKGVSPILVDKLVALNESLKAESVAWRITEGFPPSQVHQNACHNAGTCIDANVIPDAKTIMKFINAAQKNNLKAIYEVETNQQRDALVAAGVRSVNILPLPPINGKRQITAPHFSVYNQ